MGSEVSLGREYAKVCGEDKENDDEINEIKGGEARRKREMMRKKELGRKKGEWK